MDATVLRTARNRASGTVEVDAAVGPKSTVYRSWRVARASVVHSGLVRRLTALTCSRPLVVQRMERDGRVLMGVHVGRQPESVVGWSLSPSLLADDDGSGLPPCAVIERDAPPSRPAARSVGLVHSTVHRVAVHDVHAVPAAAHMNPAGRTGVDQLLEFALQGRAIPIDAVVLRSDDAGVTVPWWAVVTPTPVRLGGDAGLTAERV